MNPIRELADLVEQQANGSRASAAVADYIARADLDRTRLERTLDAFRRALRDYLQAKGESPEQVLCSFCHKSQEEVAALVVASTAAICDECTELSADVIADRAKKTGVRSKLGAALEVITRGRRRS